MLMMNERLERSGEDRPGIYAFHSEISEGRGHLYTNQCVVVHRRRDGNATSLYPQTAGVTRLRIYGPVEMACW